VEHQVGFSVVETLRAKQAFENLAISFGVVVQAYLSDIGTFKPFICESYSTTFSKNHFCRANAHHKNDVAKCAILSVSNMVCAMICHAS